MFTFLKKLIRTTSFVWDVFKEYRLKIVFISLLGFASGLFGGLGIGIIIPLFSLLSPQNASAPDFITRSIQKVFSVIHVPLTIPYLLAFIVLVFVVKAIFIFWAKYYNEVVASQYEKDTRTQLFKETLMSTWPNLLEYKLGFLERVLSYDIQRSTDLFTSTGGIVISLTSLIAYGVIAVNLSLSVTVAMGVFGIILFFLMKPLFYRTRKLATMIADIYKTVSHHINESMLGVKIIKVNGIEKQVSAAAEKHFEDLRVIRIKNTIYNYGIGSSFEPIGFVFIGAMVLFNYNAPAFNIASFAVVVYLIQRIFLLVQTLQGQAQDINQLIPYIKTTSDYAERAKQHKEIDKHTGKFSFNDSISFQDITFSYGDKLVLNKMSLNIDKGSMVGFIGPSGAGKTTIADLLLRLFRPESGAILLDGKNIQEIALKAWRNKIGYVPQEVFLLNDTVENNIKFYDDSISHQDVIQSAKMANIYETIQELPNGFETEVGERGVKLSGGQRQRIALARTLARKPEILILDEATSSLDNESEALIQKAINSLKKKMTIIVIAHRLSTVMNADRIFLLDEGKIAEEGTPEELLNDSNSYFNRLNRT